MQSMPIPGPGPPTTDLTEKVRGAQGLSLRLRVSHSPRLGCVQPEISACVPHVNIVKCQVKI